MSQDEPPTAGDSTLSAARYEERPGERAGQGVLVRRGDCILSIAARHGLSAEAIWDAPENAELRRLRGEPTQLMPGDMVHVDGGHPPAQNPCTVGATNRFVANVPLVEVSVRFEHDGQPLANQPYELIADGLRRTGTTTGDGSVTASVRATSRRALLRLGEGDRARHYEIELGQLDPHDTLIGMQTRLSHLGYYNAPLDGVLGPLTRMALAAFQRHAGLTESGEPDDATGARLRDEHGG